MTIHSSETQRFNGLNSLLKLLGNWKSVKTFLLEYDGIECRSPKTCMRDFFAAGYASRLQIESLLSMVDDRNLATHTYHESLAEDIFKHIEEYIELFDAVYAAIAEKTII